MKQEYKALVQYRIEQAYESLDSAVSRTFYYITRASKRYFQ
jgi:hypothetical protein